MSSRPHKAVAQNGVGQKKNGTNKSTNHHNKNNNNKNNNNNNNNRQQICRYFAQGGNCHFGDTCKFVHAASNHTNTPSSNKSSNDTNQSSTPASSNTPPVKTWASLAAGKSSSTAAAPSTSSTIAPPSNPSTTKPSTTPAATTPSNPLPTPTPVPATTPAAPATAAAKPLTDAATTTPSVEAKKDATSEKKETDPTPSATPSPAPAATPATTSSTVAPTATPSPPPAAPKPKPSSWAALVKPQSSSANTSNTPIQPAATNHTGEEKPKRQKKNKVKKEKPAPVVDAAALEAESGEGWTKVSSKKEEKKSAPIQNGKYNKPAKNGKFSSPFGSPLCHHFLEGKCRFTDTCSLSHTFPAVDDQSNTDINDRLIKYGAAVIGPASIIDSWIQSANQSLDALRHAISGADERLEVDQVVAIPLAAAIEAYKNGRLVAYLTSSAADNGAGLNLSESYRRASFVLGAVDPKLHVSAGRLERVLKLINDRAADASWATVALSSSTKIISVIETPLFAGEELGVGASITFNVPSGKPESGDKAIDSVLRELFEEAMIDFGSAAELSSVTVQNKLWASTPVPRNKLLHVRFIVIDPSKFDASTISTTTIKKDRSVIPHWTSKAPALRSLLTDAERKLRSTNLKTCLIKDKPIAVKDAAHIKIVWNNTAAASSASKSVNHSNAAPSKPATPSAVASVSTEKKSWGNKK